MAQCQKCKNQISDHDKTCQNCGSEIYNNGKSTQEENNSKIKKKTIISIIVIVILISIIALVLITSSKLSTKNEIARLETLAQNYSENENYEDAIRTYKEILKIEDSERIEGIIDGLQLKLKTQEDLNAYSDKINLLLLSSKIP